jgi:acyl transferase domain-containing protein/NADPH:quinone reductase-like Zn-dependent oxidoreductase
LVTRVSIEGGPLTGAVAITGIGCRFPGGVHSPSEYWKFLVGKGDGIVEVPPDRWNLDMFYDADPDAPGRMYTRRGGFLTDPLWSFDPEFFGISPREASIMDPQQRLVLEVAWEALDDGGMAGRVGGRDVGVYVGAFMNDNQVRRHLPGARAALNGHTPTSGTFTMLSNRLSYVLDLRGPSMTIDTACSSSLVAIHEASQAVIRGECEAAIAGGVNVMLHPETTISMCKGRFLAPDGRCKSFDAAADGYARGEGAGMILLRPIEAALEDADRIYAVIRGSGSNQDGRTSGITVPSPEAQAKLVARVCAEAQIDPAAVGYVEAHGTGTAIGDPIEMAALGESLGAVDGRVEPLLVGSVKPAIGHLEAAAGVAGVIKAALTVYHRAILPQTWLQTLNPAIPFAELNLRVPTEVESFPACYSQPIVAVNGFGYGGTNAHVVMSAAPAPTPPPAPSAIGLFPVSGANETAGRSLAGETAALVIDSASCDVLCDAAWTRRAHHQFRAAAVYRDADDLAAQLAQLADPNGRSFGRVVVPAGTDPVFVFSGMGPQWWRMGRDLLEAGGAFARTARVIDAEFAAIGQFSIIDELLRDETTSRVTHTEIAQPANFLLQVALVAELETLGVRPSVVVGHSVGEVTTAYVSGALSLRDAVLVSYHRARLQATTAGSGGMMAVGLPVADLSRWITDDSPLCVAAVNGPSAVTLAGGHAALEELQISLDDAGVFARQLRVEVPYHSSLMDPILADLERSLGALRPRTPLVSLYSTVTGREVIDASLGAAYWLDNVRQPVQFAKTINALIDAGHRAFLEIGPHPVLSGNVREMIIRGGEPGACISTLVRGQNDRVSLLRGVADLYVAGCLETGKVPGADDRPVGHVDLPAYPWQRRHLWSEESEVARLRLGTPGTRPLLGERIDSRAPEWQVELSATRLPWLRDHVVDGHVVLPGAAYLDAALSIAAERTGHETLAIESVRFVSPLVIGEHDVPVLRLSVDDNTKRFLLSSRTASGGEWTINASGRLLDGHLEPPATPVPCENDARRVSSDDIYTQLNQTKLHYGLAFRRILEARVGTETVVATIDATFASDGGHVACPTVVDAALQCVALLLAPATAAEGTFVPASIGAVRRFAPLTPTVTVFGGRRAGPGLHADVVICGPGGEVLIELVDIGFSRIDPPVPAISELAGLFYEMEWEWRDRPSNQPQQADLAGQLALVVDLGAAPSVRARALVAAHPRGYHIAVQPSEEPSATTHIAEIIRKGVRDADVNQVLLIVLAGAWHTTAEAPVGLDAIAGLVAAAGGAQDALNDLALNQPVGPGTPAGWGATAVHGVVVTEHAFRLPGDQHQPDLAHAALVGARRALRNEQPSARWRLVDVDPEIPIGELRAELHRADFVAGDDDVDEVCLRQGSRMVPRLRRSLARHLERFSETAQVTDTAQSFELDPPQSGLLSDVGLRSCARAAPGPGEVELRIEAVGLDGGDSTQLLSARSTEHAVGRPLKGRPGMEGFGVITRVGPEITDLAPGDHVLLVSRDIFRRYVTMRVDGGFVGRVTRETGGKYCGSLLPLITARYALGEVTGVTVGETVLIHGADGGAGLAAVAVARSLGARVIAGASSPETRSAARAAGAEEVVNSGSLNFVDDVLRMTDGRGVDVVFNFLPGEVVHQHLRVVAEFGRVVELGKTGSRGDGVLELRQFDRNLSFTAVDIDRLLDFRRGAFSRIAGEVLARLDSGEYGPLSSTSYRLSQLTEAFAVADLAGGVNRVIVTFDRPAAVRPSRMTFAVRADATYLVTGGFGAFGMATAKWLASRGARHLVLVGRRGASTAAACRQLESLRADGVKVMEQRADVANLAEVEAVIRAALDTMPPIRGVFHAAGVIDDRALAEIDTASLARVLNPKTRGALNLHTVLDRLECDLDAFVLYSSVSALVGPVPQIAYAGANAALDALAVARRAHGKPALSVNWGALAGGGMAEASSDIERYLALLGVRPIPMDRATAMLEECLALGGDMVGVVVSDNDWGKYGSVCPASASSTRFAEHVAAARSDDSATVTLRREIMRLPEDTRCEVLACVLAEQLAVVLGVGADSVDLVTPLPELGVDSLMSVEFAAGVFFTLGVEISALEYSRGSGLLGIAGRLLTSIANEEVGEGEAQAASAGVELSDVA